MRTIFGAVVCLFATVAAASAPLQIMPMGDSITYGVGVPGGYRTALYQDLSNAGLSFAFVGSGKDNASATLTTAGQTANDGVPYFTTANIIDALHGPIDAVPGAPYGNSGNWLSVTPDDVLLMVGTNDLSSIGNETPAQAAANLNALVSDLTTALPNANVIVGTITPRTDAPWMATSITDYNALVANVVADHAAAGRHVSMVDMYDAINPATDLQSDGLHPNQAGYNKIGDVWANAIEADAAAVPEPGCMGLIGLAGLALCRRR